MAAVCDFHREKKQLEFAFFRIHTPGDMTFIDACIAHSADAIQWAKDHQHPGRVTEIRFFAVED